MEINKETSYMIGLFQTDGSMSKGKGNKGKFQLELSVRDEDIIYKLKEIIPFNCGIRKRTRNIKIKHYEYNEKEYIVLSVCSLEFRNLLLEYGIPYGKKSSIIKPPLHIKNLSIKDYIRGLYDGDGSLGITAQNLPYVSFTTKSDDITIFLCENISKITDKPLKIIKQNKRDDIYNIMINKEDAQIFCDEVYYYGCLAINRKIEKSNVVKNWIRPNDMCYSVKKDWTPEDDNYILTHSVEESMEYLDRTDNSIEMRLWRLKNN